MMPFAQIHIESFGKMASPQVCLIIATQAKRTCKQDTRQFSKKGGGNKEQPKKVFEVQMIAAPEAHFLGKREPHL